MDFRARDEPTSGGPSSHTATPKSNPGASSSHGRFTSQNATAEDLLSTNTVGLVNLSDFRKRRAEALELKERSSHSADGTPSSTASITRDGASTPQPVKKKVKRKNAARGKLSFAEDDEDDGDVTPSESKPASGAPTPRSNSPDERPSNGGSDADGPVLKRRLGPNAGVAFQPKAMTKTALLREAQTREQLRKEFVTMQESVKATEVVIPFVFHDGTNIPGGHCRIKKGEHIWLFLDKARKVGAELGVGGDKSRKEWARVSVDDLMLVREEIIIPHHYEFYYFLVNKTEGFNGLVFPYSAEPTLATPKSGASTPLDLSTYDPLARPDKKKMKSAIPDEELEGFNDEPSLTKVVDRRWYERNKHIFPASMWEEFDPTKDYTKTIRKDALVAML